eukprot:TRINITY_DN4246_c0_g2_i7.p1 TRINITY_DN4246_c0_g2~~TRINITY_DN4246_c0_g2_i7.p1  ORF type:complete len:295 (+),score=65.05 TRINITY_DN4246_c0_g2_i7:664-1548(+)
MEDPRQRLLYVATFVLSGLSHISNRVLSPFMPKLGETFEYEDTNFKFQAEQISSSPCVTASHAKGKLFEIHFTFDPKFTFWGKSFEIKFQSYGLIKLWVNGKEEIYVIILPSIIVNNLMTGKVFTCLGNELLCQNTTTNESVDIKFDASEEKEKNVYINTFIKDVDGNNLYQLYGRWDKEICLTDFTRKLETVLWTRTAEMIDAAHQYNFSEFTLQLNYFNLNKLGGLRLTDTRLRSDIRALELGLIAQAENEKKLLNEQEVSMANQRGVKKYQPKLFEKQKILNEFVFAPLSR